MGVTLKDGKVKVPESFHRVFKLLLEGDWMSLSESSEFGGQGLPVNIANAVHEYFYGANYCLVNYGTMGHGTGKMVHLFGTDEQKNLFLEKLYTGQWGGTMLLTEAEAGSDVGALNTYAVKNPDGTYSLSGTKIFITSGDHDLSENIIHPVLARIEGAPEGTKGISIFLVPKIWVNPDGTFGEPNDIICTGLEEKMGIHASATCTMTLGGSSNCRGLLLGEENQGMKIMFHMMNEARLGVGFQGFAYSSAAYLYALNYARERIQGKEITAGKNSKSVPIICHPDVRRMLMWMKSHVEGMRSLIYYTNKCLENSNLDSEAKHRAFFKGMVELLTPVVKAYCSQRGFEVCSQAMQVYGGYGYTKDFPVEQYTRDARIASIYEGTDGIQAMDLLGRKIGMNDGAVFKAFLEEIKKTISLAKQKEGLAELAAAVEQAADRLGQVAQQLLQMAVSPDVKTAFAFAHPFLEAFGDVVMAWMHLWRADIATTKLAGNVKKKDKDFYGGKIKTAKFFIGTVLPVTIGKLEAIKQANPAAVEMTDTEFGG